MEPSLRILIVVESAAGGVARHLHDLLRGFVARGHQIDVIYSSWRLDAIFQALMDELAPKGVRFFDVPMQTAPQPADWGHVHAVRRLHREHGPYDVIHGHSSKGGAIARLALGRHRDRIVYTAHAIVTLNQEMGAKKRALFRFAELFLARRCAAIIANSEMERRHMIEIGLPEQKLTTVLNGIDATPLPSYLDRTILGPLADRKVVGFIGRMTVQKAPVLLVEALALLRERVPEAALAMVGDGPLRTAAEARAAELGVADRIVWLGEISGRAAMPAFDAFCLPSNYESFGYVILEAQIEGVPVVSTDVGAAPDLIENGVNGFVVPVGDAAALAERLAQVLGDQSLATSLREGAKKSICRFGADAMVENTLAVYRCVIKDRGPR